MDIAEILTLIVLGITLLISIIPFVPGPVLMWLICIIYGVVSSFREFTLLSAAGVTLLMLVAASSEFWLPLLGMKTRGLSCSSVIGTLGGGLLGTIFIPIPILGTLIGAIGGAIGLEILRVGDLKVALRAGGFALESFIYGMILEVIINLSIIGVFIFSVTR